MSKQDHTTSQSQPSGARDHSLAAPKAGGSGAGDLMSRDAARQGLSRFSEGDLYRAVQAILTPSHSNRQEAVGALAEALGGSIAKLGYPVGMGIGPSADDCERASARIIDRLLSLLAWQAADFAPSSEEQPLGSPPEGTEDGQLWDEPKATGGAS